MAEIRIEKKKKPVWPWILGALLLLAAIIWLVVDTDTDNEIQTATEQVVPGEEVYTDQAEIVGTNAVEDYITFVQENNAKEEMGIDHEYTAEGIQLLTVALYDVVEKVDAEDVNLQQKKEALKQKADKIQQDPSSLKHADIIKDAFASSAELIADIQTEHFHNLEAQVSDVKETAQNIDPNNQTLDQKENVKAFFISSAQVLSDMNNKNGQ